MLLVSPPTVQTLKRVISDLISGDLDRSEVLAWQRAVQESEGWQIPISPADGYWYFYSLMFVDVPDHEGYWLRPHDFVEYLMDIEKVPGNLITHGVTHLRTHQLDLDAVRWPLAIMTDYDDIMHGLPSSRGTFEQRSDMVEHCHFSFLQRQYLLVKQFDEQTGEILLLGDSRETDAVSRLMSALSIQDYILP